MKSKNLWVDNQPIKLFGKDVGSFYYEERALLAAEPGDIVILDYEVEPRYLCKLKEIADYKLVDLICLQNRYYDLVESIRHWEKVDLLGKYVRDNNYIIRSYIPDERISLLSQHLKIVARGISFYEGNRGQLDLIMLIKKLKFHKIDTLFLNSSTMEELVSFFEKNKYVLCKPNYSIGGNGIVIIKNYNDLRECYKLKNSKIEYVLQKIIKVDLEGSIQFLFEDGKFNIYICKTYNPNNGFSGFSYPSNIDVLPQLEIDAENILNFFIHKYKSDIDSFGIDFIVSDGKIFYHDLNARKTAISYVLLLLRRIDSNFGQCDNLKIVCLYFKLKNFISYNELQEELEKSDISDSVERGEGIMIINPGTINLGLIQILSVSCLNREKEYIEKFRNMLRQKGVEIKWPDTMIQ